MPLSGGLSIGGMSRGKVKEEPWLTELSAVCLLPDLLPAQKDRPQCGHLPPQRFPVDWIVFLMSLWKYTYSSTAPSVLDHNDHPIRCYQSALLGKHHFWNIFQAYLYGTDFSPFNIREQRNAAKPTRAHADVLSHHFPLQTEMLLFQTGKCHRTILI